MATGIVALSFAKRAKEPNPVNKRISKITDDINDGLQSMGETVVLVAQWEIALALPKNSALVVTQNSATEKGGKLYLDSDDVLNMAYPAFKAANVTDVVVVANRFIHLGVVRAKVRKAGFRVIKVGIPAVGFDPSPLNLQWWCKGPIRLVTYLGLQVVGKVTGRNFHGIGEKAAQ